jgi:hypothetical protein
MDRGIPTEQTLEQMRLAESPIHYLVGTPKGRLSQLEKSFLSKPWEQVRNQIDVKLLECEGEVYVLARSADRVTKERTMRRRRLKKLWKRLGELQRHNLSRDQPLLKIGAAKKEAGRVYGLVAVTLPVTDQTSPKPMRWVSRSSMTNCASSSNSLRRERAVMRNNACQLAAVAVIGCGGSWCGFTRKRTATSP